MSANPYTTSYTGTAPGPAISWPIDGSGAWQPKVPGTLDEFPRRAKPISTANRKILNGVKIGSLAVIVGPLLWNKLKGRDLVDNNSALMFVGLGMLVFLASDSYVHCTPQLA